MTSHYDYGVGDAGVGMAAGAGTSTGTVGGSAYPSNVGASSGGGGDYRAWASSELHRPYAPVQMEAGGAGARAGAPTASSSNFQKFLNDTMPTVRLGINHHRGAQRSSSASLYTTESRQHHLHHQHNHHRQHRHHRHS